MLFICFNPYVALSCRSWWIIFMKRWYVKNILKTWFFLNILSQYPQLWKLPDIYSTKKYKSSIPKDLNLLTPGRNILCTPKSEYYTLTSFKMSWPWVFYIHVLSRLSSLSWHSFQHCWVNKAKQDEANIKVFFFFFSSRIWITKITSTNMR